MNDGMEDAGVTYELPNDQDWLLTQLVQWAELGLKSGVTLLVNGNVVSGILSSERAYVHTLKDGFAEGLEGTPSAEPIDRAFASILESVGSAHEDEGPLPYPRYAHLSEAQVFSPGNDPLPTDQTIALRIKLSSIDSFSLGKMSRSK